MVYIEPIGGITYLTFVSVALKDTFTTLPPFRRLKIFLIAHEMQFFQALLNCSFGSKFLRFFLRLFFSDSKGFAEHSRDVLCPEIELSNILISMFRLNIIIEHLEKLWYGLLSNEIDTINSLVYSINLFVHTTPRSALSVTGSIPWRSNHAGLLRLCRGRRVSSKYHVGAVL